MDFKLEDQFEEYPDVDDPQIQEKLAMKYELAECGGGRADVKLPGDTFFTQQRLYQRIGYVYDNLAFLAEAGVGKSLGQVCLAEFLRTHDLTNKRCYFITGHSQIEDFKRQLIYREDSPYITGKLRQATGNTGKTITSLIKDYYEVKSYGVFLGEIRRQIQDLNADVANEYLRETFSGAYFFFDEIQSMKLTPGKTSSKKAIRRHENYWLLWRLCHVVQRARITIASARPLTNTVQEFGYAMNLILPVNNQMPIDTEFAERYIAKMDIEFNYGEEIDWDVEKRLKHDDIEAVSDYYLERFQSYLNGRIIFVAASETGIQLSYLPLKQPTASPENQASIKQMRENQQKRTGKYAALMSLLRLLPFAKKEDGSLDLQGQTYDDYMTNAVRSKAEGFKDRNQRELLTFVFPHTKDGQNNWGTEAEKLWLKKNEEGDYIFRSDVQPLKKGKTLQWYLRNSLQSCSVKMQYVRHQAVHYPGKGYSFFDIVHGGGVEVFGLALEEGGNVWLSSGRSDQPFSRYKPRKYNLNYRAIPAGELHKHINVEPRYGIITGEVESNASMHSILDLYNHPDNIYGDYMKHIIISKKGLVGLSLMSVKYINSFYMAHNPSDLYQAIHRAKRAVSHIALVKEWKLLHPDKPFEVEVNILACIYPRGFHDVQDTTDSNISLRTYKKGLNTACIIRSYKNLNMAAWILDRRNTLSSLSDGKEECDYMSCQLDYYSGQPEDVEYDYNNYLLMYADREIENEAYSIIDVLKRESSLSLFKYVQNKYDTQEPQRSICFLAAASIVDDARKDSKYNIKDRYGFTSIVIEKQGVLYLTRKNSPIPQGPFTTYYSQNLIVIKHRSMKEILEERINTEITKVFEAVEDYGDDLAELSEFIYELRNNVKAAFLEQLISKAVANEPVPANIDSIIRIFNFEEDSGNLLETYEPTETIQQISRTKGTNYTKELILNKSICVDVHNVYAFQELKAAAGMATRATQSIGRLRIFHSHEGKWRDTNEYETIAYRMMFQQKIAEREARISTFGLYGLIVSNEPHKFRIVDKTFQKELVMGKQAQGCVCSDIAQKITIVAYMWYLDIPLDKREIAANMAEMPIEEKRIALDSHTSSKKEHIYRYVVFPDVKYSFLEHPDYTLASDKMTEYFHFYLFVKQSKYPKSILCNRIARHMNERGMIISPDMNRYQIAAAIAEQYTNSFMPAQRVKEKMRSRYA